MVGIRSQESGNITVIAVIFVMSNALFFILIQSFTPLLDYKKQVLSANTKMNMQVALDNMRTTLKNNEALKAIVNLPENAAMKCVATSSCAADMAPQNIKVVGLDGTTLSDGNNIGIDRLGQVCSTVTETTRCQFTMTLKWRAICPTDGTPCVNPPVEITADIHQTTVNLMSILNLKKLGFTIRTNNIASMIK